jgi:hypothetical protein
MILALQEDVLDKLPESCILMVALQYGLDEAQRTFKQRRVCQDVRSSLGWPEDKEEIWQNQLNATRNGFIQWFVK